MKNFLLALTLAFNLVPLAHADELPYPDWSTYIDNFEAVYQMQIKGVFAGYPDGTFGGDLKINRAELTKVLVLGAGVSEEEVESCAANANKTFTDVPEDEWYTAYVYCAQAQAWVQGDSGKTTFRPADAVNMAEAVKMIVEAKVGTPSNLAGEEWYDMYLNYLEGMVYLEERTEGDFYFTYTGDHLGSVVSEINRANVAELLYRSDPSYELPIIWLFTEDKQSLLQEGSSIRFENQEPQFSLIVPLEDDSVANMEVHELNPSGYRHGYMTTYDFSFYSELEGTYASVLSLELYSSEYYDLSQENLAGDLTELPNNVWLQVSCAQDVPEDLTGLLDLICYSNNSFELEVEGN